MVLGKKTLDPVPRKILKPPEPEWKLGHPEM